ncbi:MAG: hypothetical protein GWN58_37355, partial [Anaerolineae bacterium]|nr:hypothetical protein [Anaerolineae bacterium]
LGVPGYEKLTTAMRNGVEAFSTSAPLINGLKEEGAGALEGWQYMLFQGAQDNMWNNVQKHQISTTLNAQWNHLDELAQAADVELADIGADVLYRLEGGTGDEALLKQLEEVMGLDPENLTGIRDAIYANPELDTAVQATVDYMQATMKSYHGAL